MKMRVAYGALMYILAGWEPAQAYLDPGAANLAIQGIFATLAAAAITWKDWSWRVRSWFSGQRKGKGEVRDQQGEGRPQRSR